MPEIPPYIGKIIWNKKDVGTGFLVHKDGLIATCYHVVKLAGDPPTGKVFTFQLLAEGQTLQTIVTDKLDPKHDVALLKAIEPLPIGCEIANLVHSGAAKPGMKFLATGYGEMDDPGHTYAYLSVIGDVVGSGKRDGVDFLQLDSKQILRGMSGGPVVVEELGGVIGVISGRYSVNPDQTWMRDTGWASKSQALAALDERLQLRQYKVTNKLRAKVVYPLQRASYFVGRQSHLRSLREFWNKRTGTVIGMVGMGGTGKTAIVRQFMETQHWTESEGAPGSPDGLFVWSFYDNPDAAGFITEAYLYFSQLLKEEPIDEIVAGGRRTNVFLLADVLEKTNRRFVIVMDGLEKMQSEGVHSDLPRGTLNAPPLRHFLRRIVDGVCGQTKAIITSRFPLTDLEDWSGKQYREIGVDELELDAARNLLRKLGVHGSDVDIDLLANEYGLHALTLDLLGRLLAKYFNGDISGAKDFPTPVLERVSGSPTIEKQANKLARVLYTYEDKLAPLELTTLECLSVFRRPVDFNFLKDVFLGEGAVTIFKAIASLTPLQFKSVLYNLEKLRLVTLERDINDIERVTMHPIIRDHFYIRLTEPNELHDVVRSRLATLVDAPGYIKPKDAGAIDIIEELIYHTAKLGRTNEAYMIYQERLGYIHLGWNLGDHAKGSEIMQLFEADSSTGRGDIGQTEWEILTTDHGLYLKNLGQIDEAIRYFSRIVTEEKEREVNLGNLALALQNLSAVQVLRGRLQDAEASAQMAVHYALKTADIRIISDCRVRLATAFAMLGKREEAEELFQSASQTVRSLFTRTIAKGFPRDLPGIRLAWLLIRVGRYSEANSVLQETRDICEHFNFRIIMARTDVLTALLNYRLGKMEEAWKTINGVFSWASTAFDQEMVVATNIVAAWLSLSGKDPQRAMHFIRDGIRVDEECGYSTYWVDLKIPQGYTYLAMGDAKNAKKCAEQALLGQSQKGGRPKLFGAKSKESSYPWGEADALHLRAEAALLLGDTQVAINNLVQAREIRSRLHDIRLAETETLLEKLRTEIE